MLSIVFGFLVPAAGSCLPDAIPPSQRQNLVNANGETYPVGFLIAAWAASYASNILGATLVEEVLGYNTTFNLGDIASGAVAHYYGIAGCRTYNNNLDRGCMQGATRYHVGFEVWKGYPADWNYIQSTYASMAPKDLGSMGYTGPASMFIPGGSRDDAYSTEGLALQFFKNWNASWKQPWKYFRPISSIDTSKLAPCNRSDLVMMSDVIMRRHVRYTGDLEGVVINVAADLYSARCDDGFFWTAPSCRANPTRCVPYITAGNGWGQEDFMQKFTIHNMPVAIAVAASWEDYTTIPLSGDVAFYWWLPDPTFLELAPLMVKFPKYDPRERQNNYYASASSVTQINTIVSQDLELLAPIVVSFADKVDLPVGEMNAMLLDQKSTDDTWENVTCRWIKANRHLWQAWIPDESECYPGFGLYDSVLEDFTDQRVNATNKIVCQACPPGKFSEKLEDGEGASGQTYICLPCGKGTSQSSGASLSCKPCKPGEYQDEVQSMECKRCDIGFYQDLHGQEACTACPEGTNTLGFGAVAESDCGCPKDFIDIDRTGGFECVKCSEGMTCPPLSQLADLERGKSDNGPMYTPVIREGFFSTTANPTNVFRCPEPKYCPGGTPGSCRGGLVDTPCSQCAEGMTWTGRRCEDCAGWRQALWVLAVIIIFAVLILAYYLATSKVTAKASVIFMTTASLGMLVMSMQNLGLVGLMTVEWPVNLQGIFSICQFLLLDIDSYGFSCVAGQSETVRYLLSALMFPLGMAWLVLVYALSRFLPAEYHWEGPKTCSTIGAFLQLGFSTMSATSLAPMMCYQHPNGLKSIVKYSGVICGSDEHSTMLVIAVILLVFVFGFVTFCGYAAWKVPMWSAKGKFDHVAAVRFLVFRFRLDRWWFGVPLLIRGPLINLPVVLATDMVPIQVVAIAMILTTMMVVQMLAWPWKVPLMNAVDCIVSFGLVLIVTTSTLHLHTVDETMYAFATATCAATMLGIACAIFCMFFMTACALIYRGAMGGKEDLAFFNLGRTVPAHVLARKLQDMAKDLEGMQHEWLCEQLQNMAVFDISKISTCITLLATEVAPPADEGSTFQFNKRIASHSFDASLRRPKISSKKFSRRVSRVSQAVRRVSLLFLPGGPEPTATEPEGSPEPTPAELEAVEELPENEINDAVMEEFPPTKKETNNLGWKPNTEPTQEWI